MTPSNTPAWTCLLTCLLALASPASAQTGRVTLVKTPDGGIQPQAVADAAGTIHVVYFKGEPAAGDLFYARAKAGTTEFSKPIRVNSEPGSAVAVGTIRGGQIAIGKGGRVHIAWNGSSKAKPANPIKGVPMLYTRSDGSGTAFEPQRNLMTQTYYLDGGGTVAADDKGNVYVAWQAHHGDESAGERGRAFWVARSTDDGATFAPEEPALSRKTGACPCCGTRALVDSRGTLYALYRAASEGVDRDMMLVWSRDRAAHFEARSLQPWRLTTCPMSSETLVEGPAGVLAAWETKGQVAFARIDPRTQEVSPPVSPPGSGERKHPVAAVNRKGETLLAWAEGTGWQRGGALAWRIFDADGKPTGESGRLDGGISVWGLAAVVARPDGGFTIIH